MPTTFKVISLGALSSIDTNEGNYTAENAGDLVGMSFGDAEMPLYKNIKTFSQSDTGYGGGHSSAYDMNNNLSADTFSIDGGDDQIFDGTAVYGATITYEDGSSANITAVVFQDTEGNTYLAPEFSNNADQQAYEAGPIQSLELNTVLGSTYSGMTASREDDAFITCFAERTLILTPAGPTAVEKLKVGDAVTTVDSGPQRIRWIGRSDCLGYGNFAPVRIPKGALGQGLPERDLLISQQHRVVLSSRIIERVVGDTEIFIPAKKLVGSFDIRLCHRSPVLTYFHLMLDGHEILLAENAPVESFFAGEMARKALDENERSEIEALFHNTPRRCMNLARAVPDGKSIAKLVSRHVKNSQPFLQEWKNRKHTLC